MKLKKAKLACQILIFVVLGVVLIQGTDFALAPPSGLKEHFFLQGVKQTGAINLVSSIYLSYRAFDTLGETIVLLLTVCGIAIVFKAKK